MIGAIQLGSDIGQVERVLRQLHRLLCNWLPLVKDIGAQNIKNWKYCMSPLNYIAFNIQTMHFTEYENFSISHFVKFFMNLKNFNSDEY
jgi:hypothetical protein